MFVLSMESTGKWVYILFEVLIGVACCLGNMLVIRAVRMCGEIRQPTFFFIVSLAVADLLVGSFGIPLSVVMYIQTETCFNVCVFFCCVLMTPQVASTVILVAIAMDRYLRVCIPLKYKTLVTERCSWMVVAVCWITAVLFGFIPMYGWHNVNPLNNNNTHEDITEFKCSFLAVTPVSYLIFIFFSSLLPALVIMTVLYCYIFLSTRRQLRAHVASESKMYYQKELRLAVSLSVVLVLFSVCWLPLYFIHLVNFYGNVHVPGFLVDITVLLTHAHSAVNPVVYAFKIPKIKVAYRKMLYQLWHGKVLQQSDQSNN